MWRRAFSSPPVSRQQGLKMLLPPMGLNYRQSPEQIESLAHNLIAQLHRAEEEVLAVPQSERTVANTLEMWQGVIGTVATTQAQVTLPAMVSTDKAVRQQASAAKERLKDAFDQTYAREDLFRVFRELPKEELSMEQTRLLEASLSLFRQNGTDLAPEDRARLMALRGELTRLEFKYQQNLNEDTSSALFSADQLKGCGGKFIESLQTAEDGLLCVTTKPPDVLEVLQRCEDADVRRQVLTMRDMRCLETNIPLLLEILRTRHQIAQLLGAPSHAAARISNNMAKTPEAAEHLMRSVLKQLTPIGEEEMQKLKSLKQEHVGTGSVVLEQWDISFYSRKLREKEAQVDEELLRQYFPLEHVRDEIFRLYEELLHVRISVSEPALPTWHEDVQSFTLKDADTDQILGYFYLDLFPREGKYSHQCVVPVCPTFRRPNGTVQPPVAANIGNLPKPRPDAPSLLHHSQVLTFFHEFGHVVHHLCSRTDYCLLSWAWSVVPYPAGVEHDFLEIPSQALENWTWEAKVLKRLSKHFVSSVPLPDDEIARLQKTRLIGEGIRYRRQIFMSLLDLYLHSAAAAEAIHTAEDLFKISSTMQREMTGLEPVPSTSFLASWYHIAQGYDAGYYGYLWSEVLACDVYACFEDSPEGCMNGQLGKKYRKTILEPGAVKTGDVMLRDFLGRPPNDAAFMRRFNK